MMRFVAALFALALAPAGALAQQQPLGVVGNTLGRIDRNTLRPVGHTIPVAEPHTGPAVSPRGGRFALGVSSTGSPGLPGVGRVGLWIVDATAMTITHEVRTGIAAEAVVYPGVVAALLQDGGLVVVDPDSGHIRSRRRVGYSLCAPPAVHAAGHGIIVNELSRAGAEVVVIDPEGQVHTLFVPITTDAGACHRQVSLVASIDRGYIVGRDRVVALDPATRRTTTRRIGDLGRRRSAAAVPGGLAVASERGLRLIDTATWKVRWRDATAQSVLASGNTVIATGRDVRALDARTGRVRWRAPGRAAAVAAGRVYAQPSVLDLLTGAQRGTHPTFTTPIRII